jgi:hypothetical protein
MWPWMPWMCELGSPSLRNRMGYVRENRFHWAMTFRADPVAAKKKGEAPPPSYEGVVVIEKRAKFSPEIIKVSEFRTDSPELIGGSRFSLEPGRFSINAVLTSEELVELGTFLQNMTVDRSALDFQRQFACMKSLRTAPWAECLPRGIDLDTPWQQDEKNPDIYLASGYAGRPVDTKVGFVFAPGSTMAVSAILYGQPTMF